MAEKKLSRPAFLAFVLENFGDQMPEEYRAVGGAWYNKLTTKPDSVNPTKKQRENAKLVARVADAITAQGTPHERAGFDLRSFFSFKKVIKKS